VTCSFCGMPPSRGRKIVRRADGLLICDACVDHVLDALSDPQYVPDPGKRRVGRRIPPRPERER